MKCRACNSERIVKNGNKRGLQNHLCKECGFQFTREENRHSELDERRAVTLYCLGFSFRTIGRFMGWHHTTIMRWIMRFAKWHYKKPVPKGEIMIELDEMHHYLREKKRNYGYGKHTTERINNLLTGKLEIEIPRLLKECITD